MNLNRLLAIAVMAIASMGIATGAADAAPAAAKASTQWNVIRHGASVVVSTDNGSFAKVNNQLVLHDAHGAVVQSVPLTVAVDDFTHPVNAQVAGKTATLALDTNPLLARFQPVPHKVDLSAAVAGVKDNITLTAAIGGFLGAAAGLVGGCLLGAVAAGVVSAPAVLLFGAGPLAGCIGGALLLGSGASLAGTAIGGLGSIAANVGPFIQLLNQPAKKKS
ncbi:hypothetical protein [Gordonia hankookensis]|uniref:DUF8020 domain-containing protein n=1 Tax=Gordonia hankookensis TaxID=589403 RepID=A0ABR7WBQ2_9ACTN|nr:hypothetical protein [Gordonia hankookensis]MBD1320193.1 hypothetical protein [Gordonia hankookensis]